MRRKWMAALCVASLSMAMMTGCGNGSTQETAKETQTDVAEKLGMNPSYFSTIFKKEMGASFTEVLNTMRIEKAVELIRSGECNTSKIAEDSGFTNRKYFLQVFKKYMKQSVREYMGDWQE